MEIVVRPSIGMASKLKIKGEQLLSEIKETAGGVTRAISADELGVEALYTAVIDGIPEDLEPMTFKVTPYCTDAGTLVEGVEKTIILEGDKMTIRTEYALADHKDKIKIYGRSHPATSGIACDFSASGIEFNARLSGDVKIKVNSDGTSYYTLYINGERQETRLQFNNGTTEYTIAKDLAEGDYTFKLIKQSMIDYTESVMMSLDISGTLLDKPANKELLIEFVGDSITCGHSLVAGYGAGSNESFDATAAFAYLTAEKLGADHSLICRSGWALLEDASGNGSVATNIYPYTSYIRTNEKYVPSRKADIVVIHLGTNDVNYRKDTYGSQFVNKAKAFIESIWEMNPDAKIVWAYGSMVNSADFKAKVDAIISGLGGAANGVYSVQLPYDRSGGLTHPTATTHATSADILANFIKRTVIDQGE